MLPKMNPSSNVISNRSGDKKPINKISTVAGIKLSNTAGLPTFFRSFKSSVRPALNKITINAISRKSAEIERISGATKSKANGPNIIPVIIKAINPGSFSLINIAFNEIRF